MLAIKLYGAFFYSFTGNQDCKFAGFIEIRTFEWVEIMDYDK